ncbi:Prephenate dehydratase [Richelia intracellularis HM01]|nr:Prephenate dehydratase [Richelia intracellularis HM01]
MTISIAHLAPPGTYAEQAAIIYRNWLTQVTNEQTFFVSPLYHSPKPTFRF